LTKRGIHGGKYIRHDPLHHFEELMLPMGKGCVPEGIKKRQQRILKIVQRSFFKCFFFLFQRMQQGSQGFIEIFKFNGSGMYTFLKALILLFKLCLNLLYFRNITKKPDPPLDRSLPVVHRGRISLKKTAIKKLQFIPASFHGVGHQIFDLLQELFRIFEFIKNRLDTFSVITALLYMGRNIPHINKLFIKRDHVPLLINDQNTIG